MSEEVTEFLESVPTTKMETVGETVERPTNAFNSENFKLEIRNLGFYGYADLKKLLTKLSLNFCKVKAPFDKDVAYVCFRSAEEQSKALETLNGFKWRKKTLQAYLAKASEDPLVKYRRLKQSIDGSSSNVVRTTIEATCPLFPLPYEEQLKQKSKLVQGTLEEFFGYLLKLNGNAKDAVEKFEYLGICNSPKITSYRNKNEFAVGKNARGETTVGFRIGSYADGSIEVSSDIGDLPQIPPASKWAAETFRAFLMTTRFQPFNPDGNTGHIRQFVVRTSEHTKDIMIIVGVYSSNLNASEILDLKHEIVEYYKNVGTFKIDNSEYKVASLYYQDVKNRNRGELVSPIEHLAFETYITDKLYDLEFRISPLAFFQINIEATNVLYQKIIDFAELNSKSCVLDICCGTGTIGLVLAKFCKRVLGVDNNEEGIKDAIYNAKNNNIENCMFFAGSAEKYIRVMCKEILQREYGNEYEIVAIVDPPRAGLRNRSIASIREETMINRLLYISCSPNQAQQNWLDLCRPTSRQYKGHPFMPVKALAVDMFPHTPHVELIVLFERKKKEIFTCKK